MASQQSNRKSSQDDIDVSGPRGLEQYRAQAQQNSIEALRSAENRYEKAKQSGSAAAGGAAEAAEHAAGATKGVLGHVKDKTEVVAVDAARSAADAGKKAAGFVAEKAGYVKDSAAEKSRSAAGYVGEKAGSVKDSVAETGRSAAGYVGEKAGSVKDSVVETGRSAVVYVADKAGTVKDSVVETGRSAAETTGSKASEVKGRVGEQLKTAQEKLKNLIVGSEGDGRDFFQGTSREEFPDRNPGNGDRESAPVIDLTDEIVVQDDVYDIGKHPMELGSADKSLNVVGAGKLEKGRGIFSTVGDGVIGVYQHARDMIFGPSRGDGRR